MTRFRNLTPLLLLFLAPAALGQTAWERFLDEPSSANAAKVDKPAYSSKENEERIWEDLLVLEDQMLGGDAASMDLCFRLLRGSDGHLAETLFTMVGRTIRADPENYLRAVQRNRDGIGSGLSSTVEMLGEQYVDREIAWKYEFAKRLEAIRGVKTPGLRATRDEILKLFADQ